MKNYKCTCVASKEGEKLKKNRTVLVWCDCAVLHVSARWGTMVPTCDCRPYRDHREWARRKCVITAGWKNDNEPKENKKDVGERKVGWGFTLITPRPFPSNDGCNNSFSRRLHHAHTHKHTYAHTHALQRPVLVTRSTVAVGRTEII